MLRTLSVFESDLEEFILMNKNTKVLKFERRNGIIRIVEVYNDSSVPFSCKRNYDRFSSWIQDRPIPTNQEHINAVLESVNITSRDVLELLKVNSGFSLNDSYWIVPLTSNDVTSPNITWDSNNLYSNDFSESLGMVTFFGNPSSLGGTLHSPEITNQGSVGKAWRQEHNSLVLYKKASEGAANFGKDHWSEVIASRILKIIDVPHVDYWLNQWHGKQCSCCRIFTNENVGYLPMYSYLEGLGKTDRTLWNYSLLESVMPSEKDVQQLRDMVVFDFIIENWDRHYSNFGFLINNDTQEILGLAPIFDNGYSLMCRDLDSDFVERDYISYTKPSAVARGMTNRDLFLNLKLTSSDVRRYKHWAKEIRTNIDYVLNVPAYDWYLNGVKQLLMSRCRILEEIVKWIEK